MCCIASSTTFWDISINFWDFSFIQISPHWFVLFNIKSNGPGLTDVQDFCKALYKNVHVVFHSTIFVPSLSLFPWLFALNLSKLIFCEFILVSQFVDNWNIIM